MAAVCSAILLVAVVSSAAFARLVENWSYDRLFKEAELIVIAQPIKSENCIDRFSDNPWKVEFLGVNTTFRIDHVLKGKHEEAELTVLHFKTNVEMNDGPMLVSFRTNNLSYLVQKEGHAGEQVNVSGPATYLLFLKASADGRFQPVSGKIDPALSVREMTTPTPLEIM